MAQIFKPSTNTIAWVSGTALVIGVALVGWAADTIMSSPYITNIDMVRPQPVLFSHRHHVGGLGLDCRFCHAAVETAATAGMPSTETCMGCHAQVWPRATELAPVRESLRTNMPIRWNRVHDLPDFVYFNHSIHVQKGIGCVSCHGQVNDMPLVRQTQPLTMAWCLQCHRAPEKQIRPREEVFNMAWVPPPDREERGRQLVHEYGIDPTRITNCYSCHR
jgi:hypothetical protein